MNHPDFRIEGKIFAALGSPDESWGMVKLTPEQQRSFVGEAPGVFDPCSDVWGQRGATNIIEPCVQILTFKIARVQPEGKGEFLP